MATALDDITDNLLSLSFDAEFTEDERELMYVRKRSHAIRTSMIGQACYLAAVINEGKRMIFEKEKKGSAKQESTWKEVHKRRPMKIGVLGCGALGRILVRNLQKFSDIYPEEIMISTRRPELLTEFSNMGVKCFFDNKKLVKSTDLTFLCCLPSHLEEVIEDIEGSVRCLFYSFVAGFPRQKMCTRLNFSDVIKPDFVLANKENTLKSSWNHRQSISHALQSPSMSEISFPGRGQQAIVSTSYQLAEVMFFVFVNMCIVQGLARKEILKMANTIMFGFGNEEDDLMLTEDDVWNQETYSILNNVSVQDNNYEIFRIDKLHASTTDIGNILKDPQSPLGMRFRRRYVLLFDKLSSWKTQCELVLN